jgi:hypothetical protein
MKRPMTTRIKELELSKARLSNLCVKRDARDSEIARLQERHEREVSQVIMDTVLRLGLSKLPVTDTIVALEALAHNACDDGVSLKSKAPDDLDSSGQNLMKTSARLSRNASPANRQKLEAAGLAWNGRLGRWTGAVTTASLERLRATFGERMEVLNITDPATASVSEAGKANDPPTAVEIVPEAPIAPQEQQAAEEPDAIVPLAPPGPWTPARLPPRHRRVST